ncbi:MAG: tRNA-dihydrouridine synthase [Spirochaetaceae bacterium]|nr:tRNA-dihydrouridine synthase [Spirochaetaceae bacterium]
MSGTILHAGDRPAVQARSFWDDLPRPFFVVAPMANATDTAFRRVITECSSPHAVYTEFTSVAGLCSRGAPRLMVDLEFAECERPVIAQFFGSVPEQFRRCAELAVELGFDGVDINMGCPDRAVLRQKAGAALIRDPDLAVEIIDATRAGAGDLPVSVKTRIGDASDIVEEWIGRLLGARPAAIAIHARTIKERSEVPAHWDAVRRACELAHGTGVPIVGNGDVRSLEQGRALAAETGADGVMIGRGVFGNPWLFSAAGGPGDLRVAVETMLAHALVYDLLFAGRKNFVDMRRHFKAYVGGFHGARRLRMELMETRSVADVERIVGPVIGAESLRRAHDRAHALASADAWATRRNGAVELTVKTAG